MKRAAISVLIVTLICPSIAFGLTVDESVTREFVRTHPNTIIIDAIEQEKDIVEFSIRLTVNDSRYVNEHLVVRDIDKTLAEIRRPMFSKNETNTYRFSMDRKLIATSAYTLSVSAVLERRGQPPLPVPGTINYVVQLSDFVAD